jgi:hypothetical protein
MTNIKVNIKDCIELQMMLDDAGIKNGVIISAEKYERLKRLEENVNQLIEGYKRCLADLTNSNHIKYAKAVLKDLESLSG